MAGLRKKFGFESSPVLVEGEIFRPRSEAKHRWYEETRLFAPGSPENFRILYELADGRFVTAIYRRCYPHIERRWFRETVIWTSEEQPQLGYVPGWTVVYFLREWGIDIPPHLEEFLKPPPPPPVREVSHWTGKGYYAWLTPKSAHDVDVLKATDELLYLGVVCVHEIRTWKSPGGLCPKKMTWSFAVALLRHFRVDPKRWWGTKDVIPPDGVGLVDVPWPTGTEAIRDSIRRLLADFEGLIIAVTYAFEPGHPDMQTGEEQVAFDKMLMDSLPDLERRIVRIRSELEAYRAVDEQLGEEEDDETKPPKQPTEYEFFLYHLAIATGGKQWEIADLFTLATNLPMSQGQVSRAVQKVRRWNAALNPITPVEQLRHLVIGTLAPNILELGPRGDGRTSRQRPKPSSE